ncbi:ABC transporter permease subunit [Paenibacillus nanensis]|nr:ABC transporter permease subunit [Paenibacillus nanensis]
MRKTIFLKMFYTLLIAVVAVVTLPGLPFGGSKDTAPQQASASAADSSPNTGEKGTIVMGTSPDYPPYENVDAKSNGEIVGMDIDIAKAIAAKLGYKLEFAPMDFNGLIAALQTKRVDFVMSAMSVTEERKQNVDFSSTYYVARNTIVSRESEPIDNIEELSGKIVGTQLGSTQDEFAETLEGVELKKLNRIPDLIQELKTGRINAAIVEDAVAVEMVASNPDLKVSYLPAGSSEDGYAIAFPKDSELLASFNEALEEMKANGQLEEITKKWFASEDASEETAADKGTIVMGTSPDYPPYENVDAKNNGEIVGMDIDIAKSIAAELGYKLEIAPMDFNGLIAALQTNRVDFVMSAMSVTEERKQNVDFSSTYYVARNTIVSRESEPINTIEELAGKIVGTQLGSTQDEFAETLEGLELKKLNRIPDLIQELKTGRVNAVIVEDAVAVEMVASNPDLKVSYLPAGSSEDGYAIAFPKGSELVAPFNEVLEKMKASGQIEEITEKWFATEETTKDKPFLNLNFGILKGYVPYILKGIYVTLLFTLVSAAFGFILGTILSLFKISGIKPLEWFATAYTSVFRGTPLLLQLFLIYYATPQVFDYDISPLMAAGLAFGLNSAAYLSETIRGGIMAVDKGQREAAEALGIPYWTMMFRIILPQAVRTILPALVNECVALLKESSLVSVIGVMDIMRRANVVQATEFRALEALLFAGLIYYVLVLILTSFARLLERRLRRSD